MLQIYEEAKQQKEINSNSHPKCYTITIHPVCKIYGCQMATLLNFIVDKTNKKH